MMARHRAVDAVEARVFAIAYVAERVMGAGPVAGCDVCGGGCREEVGRVCEWHEDGAHSSAALDRRRAKCD